MALTTKQQYWANHLEQADAFAGSVAEYARVQGLSPKALYQWRGILKQRTASSTVESAPTFTEVVHTEPAQRTSSLTLSLGRAQLQFGTLPDEDWLARLIAAHG